MKITGYRSVVKAAALFLALTLFSWAGVCGTLTLDPFAQTVSLGTPVTIDIVVSGLANPPALAAYTGMQITFNSLILQAAGVVFTNRLGDISDPAQVVYSYNTFLPGMILLDQASLLSALELYGAQASPTQTFVLATLTFNTIGGGTSGVSLDPGTVSDENGDPLAMSVNNASVTVLGGGSVPEPSTWLLVAAGAGCVAFRRRLGR